MLGSPKNPRNYFRLAANWLGFAFWVALTLLVHSWNAQDVFVDGKTFFIDADCYSRMTRVKAVMERPFQSIRHHDFENFPQGIDTHTTAPMDWTIASLAGVLKFKYPKAEARDYAGAWVSPLLGAALAGFLWIWAGRLRLPYRGALMLLFALSPILTHGFLLGRPDHQSLEIVLLGVALAAELAMWMTPSRAWSITSGVAWGLAFWTSLYEPPILLVIVLLLRSVFKKPLRAIWHPGYIAFVAICLVAVIFDGWRVRGLDPVVTQFFGKWSSQIGELRHAPISALFSWTGWLLPVVPILLFRRGWKHRVPECLFLGVVLVVMIGLTIWQERWGYFLALVFALSLPWALQGIRRPAAAWTALIISLWPVAQHWDANLFPGSEEIAAREERRVDAFLLRQTADELAKMPKAGVVAPWWLSPPIAYWSGQPCLAGSSHQSLPGTVDTARIYLARSAPEALDIMRKRGAKYLVAYEPSRILGNSGTLLGVAPTMNMLGAVIYSQPAQAPSELRFVYQNQYFKLYELP